MRKIRIAKIFKSGARQAVHLPADFRFEGKDIYAVRNDATGDVVLTKHPGRTVWKDFFNLMATIDVPEDFMQERPATAGYESAQECARGQGLDLPSLNREGEI